ncbi:MAG: DUF2339 domain-containing protein [Propylenella sp.]
MWGLLILLVLWLALAPLLALVFVRRLRFRADDLQRRVQALELRLAGTPAGAPPTEMPSAAEGPWARPAKPPAPAEPVPPEPVAAETPIPEPAAAAIPEPPAPPPPPPPPSAPAGPRESLETKIGARWTVLVGGLALALGAVFLVRYTIEQGLIGPGMRIVLGALLSAVLFGAGEWTRRRDRALDLPILAKADVPAILTAAAGVAAFATIYAAHALYGFIGPAAAFVLLTAAGLVTLFLSVIHGPALAAIGALGSYVAPLLVTSTDPSPLPVALHVLAITAAVLGMARIRGWRWLAVAGVVASLAWGVLIAAIGGTNVTTAELLLVAGLTAIFIAAFAAGVAPVALRDRRPDPYALASLAGVAMLSVYYSIDPLYPYLVAGILLVGALGAAGSRWTPLAGAALIAGALAVVTTMLIPVPFSAELGTFRYGDYAWNIGGDAVLPRFSLKAFAIAFVVGVGSFFSADRAAARAPIAAGLFAGAGAGAPLLILIVVYLRHVPFETRPAVGLVALVIAAVFAAMTERLILHRPHDDAAPAPALYAAGAVLSLSFAMAVGLATRFIPLALALGAAGIVWVSLYRPVRLLSWLAVVSAGLACVAIAAGPPLTPEEIGTRPFFNGLILRLGLPALAIILAGEVLRRSNDGVPARILQTIGLVFAALFVTTEIRHYANGGVIAAGPPGLGEQGALTMAALAFALGLQRIARQTQSRLYEVASLVAGVIGAAMIALGHLITANPLLTGESVGTGRVFNALLPGYLLPAIMAAWVAAAARAVRPRWYVLMVAALSLVLAFAYVTLVVRHAFWGEFLDRPRILDAENWTYSAVWLVFGILLLASGGLLRSTMVRAASGLVIAAVVFKVFLFDMAALTGALRAASFLGLGATLIVIGRLYQRLLMRGRAAEATPPPS